MKNDNSLRIGTESDGSHHKNLWTNGTGTISLPLKSLQWRSVPPTSIWDHAIDLLPDTPNTLDCKVYPLALTEGEALINFLNEQLAKGYIHPSKSPYASPFFFIKKKDGKLQPVQDYRKLNTLTVKNCYPLPLIPEIIDKVQDARLFTKLDVRWGYSCGQAKSSNCISQQPDFSGKN